jgi:hypothetical protein
MDNIYIDNRVFKINGQGDEMLLAVLELAFAHQGGALAVGWTADPKKGLILYWTSCLDENVNEFPAKSSPNTILPLVVSWLAKDETWENNEFDYSWDMDMDHDGDNSRGWRVYCNDWGHIDRIRGAICAIKPAHMWHGK